MTKKALGKGLGAIISTSPTPAAEIENIVVEDKNRIREIELGKILPNPDQPRTVFDENEIEGLAESIKAVGLIMPIIVRENAGQFIIVAGERRYRACKLNEMKKIKAIVIEADEEQNFTMALIENIQRADLNPIEEARAYKLLIDRFKLKQQDVAKRVGKERTTITNSLRLLNLPEDVQNGLIDRKITQGHAKVLLSIEDQRKLMNVYNQIVDNGISVRALESMLNGTKETVSSGNGSGQKAFQPKSSQIKKMEEDLISKLGTKVEIKHSNGKGRIEISYYSLDDFERIVEKIK
ncbi:MAG TPA: ParB/RepB/Spo0J family partition protein [Spirochaetota bacterium]|nr:ParB/RepB/Spo0J family partition protein [Spirochaetota bacterium]HPF04815.1 ParB/RepB/Spo0J family partition protein [Spirochaetota bacterium]HPJ41240.1 ParB/RepB/Spo0J family partition protein [Spirochaetota bacterium]HPR36557.1 ParB/RepB/Spo0J family partition protein [Spirochaetota bacterium]HRX46301.1 ParB/RepB/Spo0J family partition protein [Spirochaetota bacterium]